MRNLSVMEQKQVVGGYYKIKWYGADINDWGISYCYGSYSQAVNEARSHKGYHVFVYDERGNELFSDWT